MSREPNREQKLAIEHTGGVLLEAGAGSGKTFVLVEHVYYLMGKKYEELRNLNYPDDLLAEQLRDYLSGIVMMTFTNKAAGEMSLRLRDKLVDLKKESLDSDQKELLAIRYRLYEESIDSLNISTIDGFCSKLVREGFFPTLSGQFDVVDSFTYWKKIEGLILQWYETNERDKQSEVYKSFLHQLTSVTSTFVTIFSTPELRTLWMNKSVDQMLEINWDEYLATICNLKGISDTLPPCPTDSKFSEFLDKDDPTSLFYKSFSSSFKSVEFHSMESFSTLYTFFQEHPAPNNTKGPRTPEAKLYKSEVKALRDFVIELGERIFPYISQKEQLREWVALLYEVFHYIDQHYLDELELCFGDLEYFVYEGLKESEVVDIISENYNYFIVDEFQDTSQIQYDILSMLIKNDLSKLFAVGDKKQAIYAFRGGEVSVFNHCSKQMEEQKLKNLYLTHNYRSLGNVIEFNNELFSTIFALGDQFEGHDHFAVDVVKQTIPLEERLGQGSIYKLEKKITADEKFSLSNEDLNYLEAEAFIKHATELFEKNPDQTICFLYKTLTPLNVLFPMLLQSDLDFTSQIKIDQQEDPIVILFDLLIRYFDEQAKELTSDRERREHELSVVEIYSKLICGVLYYLDNPQQEAEVQQLLSDLQNQYQLFGLKAVVDIFYYKLGISNSNYAANLVAIDALMEQAYDDYHQAYSLLSTGFGDRYSIEFQKGSGGKVIVMTAHASKGLEFDHVFMGGLSTNGSRVPDRNLIGKEPGSFRWRVDLAKKEMIDTPQFYLEKEIAKAKDFAESKRLFYVVGTRAEKAISWVDLVSENPKEMKYLGVNNSWIHGVRAFENSIIGGIEENRLALFEHMKELGQQELIAYPFEKTVRSTGAPLFHLDHIGVESCHHRSDQEQLLVLSELSVTSLTALSSCPKRFYLKNILKIDPHSLQDILEMEEDSLSDEYKQRREEGSYEQEVISLLPKSTNSDEKEGAAQRGTRIHDAIYRIVDNGFDFVPILDHLSTRDQKAVEWAAQLAEQEKEEGRKLIAEVEVKFDFFGMKISGIPDLVVIDDENRKVEIWDYKTGRRSPEKDMVYSTQLKYYAYGLLKLDQKRHDYAVSGTLLYVDSQKRVDFDFEYNQLKEFLFSEFSKMNQLSQENRESCQFCMFRQLCPPLANL